MHHHASAPYVLQGHRGKKKSRRAQSQYIIDAQSYKEAAVVLFC